MQTVTEAKKIISINGYQFDIYLLEEPDTLTVDIQLRDTRPSTEDKVERVMFRQWERS